MNSRTSARRRAVEVVFEAEQRHIAAGAEQPLAEVIDEVLNERIASPREDTSIGDYAAGLVRRVSRHLETIDEWLETYSHGWSVARMPAVDRAILRVCAMEIVDDNDVPDGVILDNATTLAQKLSTDDSPPFINGLLGRLAQMKSVLEIVE